MSQSLADQANLQMVDRMIAEGALWSPALITAFRATPRHRFLERVFQFQRKHERWREVLTSDLTPEDIRLLYSDRALITHVRAAGPYGGTFPVSSSSQPSLMSQMLEDMKLSPELQTLEIGAGTGYNAALLAHAVAPGLVVSIDVDRNVLSEAWAHLRAFPDRRVELHHVDGRLGFPQAAPYDRIMVTASTMDIEPAWLEQLADRGLLEAPLAIAPGLAFVVRGSVAGGVFHGRLTRAAYFMALRSEDETGSGDLDSVPDFGPLRTLPAPWAGWFDRRRPRINWLGFSQSIAFYGHLRGLTLHYRSTAGEQPAFGISHQEQQALCWLGAQMWHVNGDAGRDLAWNLWREFLDAGAPWPTEYRLKASPQGGLKASHRECFLTQGPRCQHLWELPENRDRQAWI